MIMFILISFLLLQVILSELNYKDCWILKSNFNYSCPSDSYLNLAYPASIAYYYITLIPPNSNYTFIGKFLEDNVYESSDHSKQELDDFVSSLSSTQFKLIQDFFNNIPKISKKISYTKKDGTVREKTLEGLSDFF